MGVWERSRTGRLEPSAPTNNAHVEAFNSRLRAECLNASWFLSMNDARDLVESWRQDDNTARSHSAFGNLKPRVFVRQTHAARKSHKCWGNLRGETIADSLFFTRISVILTKEFSSLCKKTLL